MYLFFTTTCDSLTYFLYFIAPFANVAFWVSVSVWWFCIFCTRIKQTYIILVLVFHFNFWLQCFTVVGSELVQGRGQEGFTRKICHKRGLTLGRVPNVLSSICIKSVMHTVDTVNSFQHCTSPNQLRIPLRSHIIWVSAHAAYLKQCCSAENWKDFGHTSRIYSGYIYLINDLNVWL